MVSIESFASKAPAYIYCTLLAISRYIYNRLKAQDAQEGNMAFDPEIEKINKKKFEEMMQQRQQEQASQGSETHPDKPITLTDATFLYELSRHPVMVVDFWAAWCGPCKMVAPVIEELADQYAGKVAFGKLNVDENPQVSQSFGVQSIPTILVFKNGRPVDGVVGAVPKSQIESKFVAYINSASGPSSPYR
jgi:thioredoxin 1